MRKLARTAGVAALAAATCALALAAENPPPAKPAAAPPPPKASLRDAQDRPVLAFAQGPASLLLTPQELLAYGKLVDLGQRRGFIERFWGSMAVNCLPGTNPVRDQYWQRADEAVVKFSDEGLPGWATDRGRIYVLAGSPEKEEPFAAKATWGDARGLAWTYPERPGVPQAIYFVEQRGRWVYAGSSDTAAAAPPATLAPGQWAENVQRMATAFRSTGCVLTPEQAAERARVAWRGTLYDEAGKVLTGEKPAVAQPVEPQAWFFPAEGDSTLIWLAVPLDGPLPIGSKLVAMLRSDSGDDVAYALGTDDFPFEVRPLGDRHVGLAARPLPPGKYALVIGRTAEDGTTTLLHAGQQMVARLPLDTLRTTSVVLAQEVSPVEAGAARDPFQIGSWRLLPRADRTIKRGDKFWLVYKVLGAAKDAAGQNNLQVTYQFRGRMQPTAQWQPIGQPIVRDLTSDTTAIEFPTSPQWPPTAEYRVEILVADKLAGGAPFKIEVPFALKP